MPQVISAVARRRRPLAGVLAVLLLSVAAAGGAIWWLSGDEPSGPRAVIIDQLGITDPNPGFVADATQQLEAAGYKVDYFPPEAVTVDLYRGLPDRGYKLILLRSHSSQERIETDATVGVGSDAQLARGTVKQAVVGLFTNEVYSQKEHVDEQRALQLAIASYPDRDIDERYFGLNPEFISKGAKGSFGGATIILMGCGGLSSTSMARAFLERGAGEFISWDGPVTAEHTDSAAQTLLQNLLTGHPLASRAVADTMAKVGPDPSFGSHLLSYP